MKKVTKVFTLMLALLMVVTVFAAGCGKKTEEKKPAAETSTEVKYPTKPIQVIVPAGAGGDTDLNSRMIGKYMEKELGQPLAVVNVSGAGGTLGTQKVKDAAPDGYTVLFFHNNVLLNNLLGLANYTFSDFENGGMAILDKSGVWAVSAKSKYKTLKDLIDDAKNNPGKIKYATEYGAFSHLQGLAFQEAAGVELNIVDVGGNAAKTAALKGDQIDVISTQYGLIKDFVTKGDFRVLGVLSDERNPLMSDVPTFKEQGVNMVFDKCFYYLFPKGTPKEIVDKFTKALEKVLKNEELKKEATKFIVTPSYKSPSDCASYLKNAAEYYGTFKDKIKPVKK